MLASYGGQRHEYQPGRRANFKKAPQPSRAFQIKVLIGSTAIVVGSFLITLSILEVYDVFNIVTR